MGAASSRPLRVLHVLAEKGYSGGENQLRALLMHMKAKGHESQLVLRPGARFRECAEELGLPVHEAKMANEFDLRAVYRLRKIFRDLDVDLVHYACSRSHKLGAAASLLLEDRTPRVVTRRMDYAPKKSARMRWLYGRAVGAVVVVSNEIRRQIEALDVPPGQIHVIPDGVPCKDLQRQVAAQDRALARKKLGIPEGALAILTMASLHERKGHDVLFEALEGLEVPEGLELFWGIAGEGPLRSSLEERARSRKGRVQVRVLGQVEEPGVALAACDLFCLPSRKEGLGVAVLEAMAVALPCVASEVGGLKDSILPGQTGLLVPPGDVAQLREAILCLATEPELRRQMGLAGRKRAEEVFDLSLMCEQTEHVYQELAFGGRDSGSR